MENCSSNFGWPSPKKEKMRLLLSALDLAQGLETNRIMMNVLIVCVLGYSSQNVEPLFELASNRFSSILFTFSYFLHVVGFKKLYRV